MWFTAHCAALELLGAFALHMAVGSPNWLHKAHPARLFIRLEKFFEGLLREKMGFELRRAGGVLAALCVTIAFVLGLLLGGLGWPVRVILMAYAFSCASEFSRPRRALSALRRHDLTRAREAMAEYGKVDTDRMSERDIIAACATHIGHTLCDSFAAPLFWICIGSLLGVPAPFALAWVCIDTLDARVGTRSHSNTDIGWFSARLSDVTGFLPAWLSGWAIIVASAILRMDFRRAIRIMGRDRRAYKSPNGGWAVASLAGALGIALGGDERVGGVVMHRRLIGDATRAPETEDIARSLRVLLTVVLESLLPVALLLALLRV